MFRHLINITKQVLERVKNRFGKNKNKVDAEEINRYLDEQDRRHYTEKDDDVYSVTTVISELEGESEGLKWWRKHNDGVGDNPDWEHILEYKQDRGTLSHHAAMATQYEALNDGEELWSGDETSSLNRVMDRVGDEEFLYSIVADRDWVDTQEGYEILKENEDIDISDILMDDLGYFTQEYDRICRERGINVNTLEAVEEMFLVPPNHEHNGYGGQADLVYRDPLSGGVVVADLKTSSDVRDKHKYQAAAYAKAIEKTDNLPVEEVERAEIIRIYPDEEETEVHEFEDFDQYWEEFAETTYEM